MYVSYLKGTTGLGLFYPSQNNLKFTTFSNYNWGTTYEDHCSVFGYCIYLGDALVSWKTKHQPIVPTSIIEAEYRALALAKEEILWLSYILCDLDV